mmetsp:Transcript_57887/g.166034  ORF Transcript_57887/g.166034 Transcript_57887/m.166034 type:complete len:707 (+) Transcript_57887:84-2204(+)
MASVSEVCKQMDFCCNSEEEGHAGPVMAFVGQGEGTYKAETTYHFVGPGQGHYEVIPAQAAPRSRMTMCHKVSIGSVVVVALLASVTYYENSRRMAEDYDCDGDGQHECGTFDYSKAGCANRHQCGQFYKLGDLSLGQSCRCRRCVTADLKGSAFGDKTLTEPGTEGSPYKGMYWGHWKNWGDHIDTCAPWVMPADEDSIRNLLNYARTNGYKVRISGAGHSAGGLVTDGENTEVLVISLGEYKSSDEEWEFGMRSMPDGSARATVNAGWTFMHLFQKIRPKGFFVPATTAGYYFSLGGVVANGVHGGGYEKGFIYTYVTRMRVMGYDGVIRIVEDEEELKHWRGSFGLLGLILGMEFRLEKREQLTMETVQRTLTSWSADDVWGFIKKDAEAKLPLDIVAAGGSSGSQKSWNGQYFIDFMGSSPPTVVAYKMKANESVELAFNGQTGCPADAAKEYQEMLDESVYLEGHGTMSWGKATRRDGSPPLSVAGLDLNKVLETFNWIPMAKAMSWSSLRGIERLVQSFSGTVNDGFFLYRTPAALAGAFYFKPEDAFRALDYLRNVQLASASSEEFVWNLPAEFRFITVKNVSTLAPIAPGTWMVVEMMSFADLAKTEQGWKRDMKKVEEYWVNELGAKPHLGKLFGFGETESGLVEPFRDSGTCTIFSHAQKASFNTYRQSVDPDGLFASGMGMKLLAPCATCAEFEA